MAKRFLATQKGRTIQISERSMILEVPDGIDLSKVPSHSLDGIAEDNEIRWQLAGGEDSGNADWQTVECQPGMDVSAIPVVTVMPGELEQE